MKALTIAMVLIASGCTSSPNYHRAYTPATGHASGNRDDVIQRATVALTDAGLTIASSSGGIVLTDWEQGRGMGDDARYRFRVSVQTDGAFTVDSLCQNKGALDESWSDCDATRPQWALDVVAKVEASAATAR